MPSPDHYDIFLSHAWRDGEVYDRADKSKWILSFCEALVSELKKPGLWPVQVKVFVDREEIESGVIPQHIKDALEKTLVFVPLVSHTYWTRPYCHAEFDRFGGIVRNDPLLPDVAGRPDVGRDRIIPVVLEPLSDRERETLGELKHVPFYDEGTNQSFSLERIGDGLRAMGEIAKNVAGVLRRIRGPGGPLHLKTGKVFLGFTAALAGTRTGVVSELEYFGMGVLPAGKLPGAADGFQVQVTADAKECLVAVHGFDPDFEAKPEPAFIPELAALRIIWDYTVAGGLQKMLVLTSNWKVSLSGRFKREMKQLEDELSCDRITLHDLELEKFKPLVVDAINSIDRTPQWVPRNNDVLPSGHRGVYLLRSTGDSRDARFAGLKQWLAAMPHVKIWESADPGTDDPGANLLREQWILEHATAVFVFGSKDSIDTFVKSNYRPKLERWSRARTSLGFYFTTDASGFSPPLGIVHCSADDFNPGTTASAFSSLLAAL